MLDYLRKQRTIGIAVVAVLILAGVWFLGVQTPAYTVSVDGQEVFIVQHSKDVRGLIDQMCTQQEKDYGKEVHLSNKVEYKKVYVSRSKVLTNKDIQKELDKNLKFTVVAAVISVDGKKIACLEDKNSAEGILQKLKDQYSQVAEGEKLVSMDYDEDVKVEESEAAIEEIISSDEAWSLITIGTDSPERYTVQDGDNLWLIARRNDMYVKDIVEANKLDEDAILSLGQELILVKSEPYINVIAQVEGESREKIPRQTKTISDSSSSGVRIRQSGRDGEKDISYIAVKRNGVTEEKKIIEEKIISEAVDKILVKGTKVVQLASRGGGNGVLSWPIYGTITQYYKSSHRAIDIATRSGTPVQAADSGYVTFAGWRGNYGNFVIVDHGNGIVTRYAHLSKIYVSVGQRVSRGESLGTEGSTGRSTGPHLHFEVLSNGSFTNPLNYLR